MLRSAPPDARAEFSEKSLTSVVAIAVALETEDVDTESEDKSKAESAEFLILLPITHRIAYFSIGNHVLIFSSRRKGEFEQRVANALVKPPPSVHNCPDRQSARGSEGFFHVFRFLHTSDWHLGRHLFGQSLLEDQAFALEQLLQLMDQTLPHALMIAGDIFDRSIPPESAVQLLDHFLHEAATLRRIPVFIIPGNHDSCERLGFAARILRHQGVHIFATLRDAFAPVTLKLETNSEVMIYGLPFLEPAIIGQTLQPTNAETIQAWTADAAMRAICRELLVRKNSTVPAVLLSHAFVAGCESSESEKELFIGGSSVVDPSAFAGFAYTALGHLHKPQSAGAANVRYSGSLLPYSKSEIGHSKAVLEVRLDLTAPFGNPKEIIPHHLPQLRQLRSIEGPLQTLLDEAAQAGGSDDYIIATYTDDGAVLDARAQLLLHYPHLLNVSRAQGRFSGDELQERINRLQERKSLSELDLFAEFFSAVSGQELSPAEREVLLETMTEINRLHGTLP